MTLTHLQRLEAESIHILREVVAEADKPVMLYSIGKDSAVMLHLAVKAFYPAVPPFPLLHVDTRWKFRDMYAFRARMAQETGMDLLVHINPEGVAKDINPFIHGSAIHTDIMKTDGLKQALDKYGFDAAFGGGVLGGDAGLEQDHALRRLHGHHVVDAPVVRGEPRALGGERAGLRRRRRQAPRRRDRARAGEELRVLEPPDSRGSIQPPDP